MKIVTVNVPESYIGAINKLIGENGLYPSRSELIRVAVRDFLLRELKMAKSMAKYNRSGEKEEEELDFDEENFVRVPIEKVNEKSEPIREFKSYKIIKLLEYGTSNANYNGEIYNQTQTIDNNAYTMEDKQYMSFEEIEKLKPSLIQLRETYPNLPDFKFINERLG